MHFALSCFDVNPQAVHVLGSGSCHRGPYPDAACPSVPESCMLPLQRLSRQQPSQLQDLYGAPPSILFRLKLAYLQQPGSLPLSSGIFCSNSLLVLYFAV